MKHTKYTVHLELSNHHLSDVLILTTSSFNPNITTFFWGGGPDFNMISDPILHIALIPLEKVWIQLFSLQLWINSMTGWILKLWFGKPVKEKENSEFKPKFHLKNWPCVTSCLCRGVDEYIHHFVIANNIRCFINKSWLLPCEFSYVFFLALLRLCPHPTWFSQVELCGPLGEKVGNPCIKHSDPAASLYICSCCFV